MHLVRHLAMAVQRQNLISAQLLIFLMIGSLATSLQLLLLVVGVEWFSMAIIHASVISYLLSAVLNYWLNYQYTFNSSQKHRKALIKFILVALSGVVLNALLLKALLMISVNYLFAQIIVIGILLIFNYTIHKHWTYRSYF